MLVSSVDVSLQLRQLKTVDGKHGRRLALTSFDTVTNEVRLERQYWEGPLAVHTIKEQPTECFLCIRVRRLLGAGDKAGDELHQQTQDFAIVTIVVIYIIGSS